MSAIPERDPRLAKFPAALRELLAAELAAGNAIVEIASCHPAPPAGAYVRLARLVTTRPRAKTSALDFYERNSSLYSGEWTDAQRFYFVLEPPLPPPDEPDMDAIRARVNGASTQSSLRGPRAEPATGQSDRPTKPAAERTGAASALVRRFRESMTIDFEKWREGIGFDVALIAQANDAERREIEALLLSRPVEGWRDVEALAALETPSARKALELAMIHGDAEVRGAVLRHAPELMGSDVRIAHLSAALRGARFYEGLSQALDEITAFHPPPIMTELFRGALEREGDVAVHFAAMIMFLHGKAAQPFDWAHRPFYLRFHTSVRSEREAAFRELCARVGVSADDWLRGAGEPRHSE